MTDIIRDICKTSKYFSDIKSILKYYQGVLVTSQSLTPWYYSS